MIGCFPHLIIEPPLYLLLNHLLFGSSTRHQVSCYLPLAFTCFKFLTCKTILTFCSCCMYCIFSYEVFERIFDWMVGGGRACECMSLSTFHIPTTFGCLGLSSTKLIIEEEIISGSSFIINCQTPNST